MSDLTPETALAMAHAGAHNEPEHYCRYPSSVTAPSEQMAAEVIRRLSLLGFEVRRKEEPGDEPELDSPSFKSDAQTALEARGFVRVNRRKGGAT